MNIIFMDDDDDQRELGIRLLKLRGHKGLPARNGEEAVQVLRNNEVNHAILDVQGVNRRDEGVWAARVLTVMWPKLKCVLISAGDRPTLEFPFVPKPYEIDEVLRLLGLDESEKQIGRRAINPSHGAAHIDPDILPNASDADHHAAATNGHTRESITNGKHHFDDNIATDGGKPKSKGQDEDGRSNPDHGNIDE